MKRNSYIMIALFLISLVLCSCGKNDSNIQEETIADVSAEASAESTDISVEEATVIQQEEQETVSAEDSLTEEVIDEKIEPEILHFVDVFQQEYEVEINPNIAIKKYADTCFVHDGDKLTYSDENYTSRLGVDVSRHQGDIDWHKVKEFGIEFTFIRVGYRGYGSAGNINLDERFKKNIVAAQNEGIEVGVYFFAQAINDEEAKEEAEFVIKALEGYDLQLPVVYDPESILDAPARTDDVTPEQFTRNTEIFCKAIKEAGYSPMIYSNMLWEAYNLDLEQLSEYPIWYADYEPCPQTPYAFEFWQYTNEGKVPGISGAADLNIQLVKK